MDDLGQLIFVILFILFGLLSGSKKKKKPPRSKPSRQEPPASHESGHAYDAVRDDAGGHEATRPTGEPHVKSAHRAEPERAKRSLAEELLGVLQEQEDEPKSRSAIRLPEVDDEARSLETITPSFGEMPEEVSALREEELSESMPAMTRGAIEDVVEDRIHIDEGKPPSSRPWAVEETEAPEPYAIRTRAKSKRNLSRSELRHAFVMREVLGPPKALE